MSNLIGQNEINESMPPADIRKSMITYEDMYNILYKQMTTLTRKDENDAESVKLWAECLRTDSYYVHYEQSRYDTGNNNSKVFALMSPLQREVSAN